MYITFVSRLASRHHPNVRPRKKQRLLLIQLHPTQTESQTETSAKETSKAEETQIPTDTEDTENSKFYMLRGTLQGEKTALPLPYRLDDGKNMPFPFLIFQMWKRNWKKTQIAIACMKDASGDPEKHLTSPLSRNRKGMDHFFPQAKESPKTSNASEYL